MCEVISLEYKYLGGVQAPEMGTANHSQALSTFQILHNPQIPSRVVHLDVEDTGASSLMA